MPLVTIRDLTIRFRGPALLDGVDCTIEPGQKIGLLGRNGAGKSTLMRLLMGQVEPDHGTVVWSPGARVAFLPQEVPDNLQGSVEEVVRQGVAEYATAGGGTGQAVGVGTGRAGSNVGAAEPRADWQIDQLVEQLLTRMELDPTTQVQTMSSGMKRRVLLAQTLVDRPDLLLLDEPTNHLDIDAIGWLEDFLNRWSGTLMFVTHDRRFLRTLATRILEIEGGRLFDWSCDYDTFLRRKQEALAAEEKQQALFDKRLAAEEVWIRQGIKARRTRNEGRVRALKELRLIRGERRSKTGTANLQIQHTQRSGNLVAQLDDVSFAHTNASSAATESGQRVILQDFSTTIMRGDKVGIVGNNGSGKTTLLKILLGQLAPQAGTVRLGANLQIAYFDQLREQLDGSKTVEEVVADGYQTIATAQGGSRHVLGYLQDFLFTPERARTQVERLSGGERNRLLLAKLFAKPANVIVLDEPTNDLDAETLEMLEERLVDYTGTLLIVSHDREFLNNVVTSTIVFTVEADGQRQVGEYVGGYDDWLRQRAAEQSQDAKSQAPAATIKGNTTKDNVAKTSEAGPATNSASPSDGGTKLKRRLSFKEQQEFDRLPTKIEKLESELASEQALLADPQFFKQAGTAIADQQRKLQKLEAKIAACYHRLEELES